MRNWNDPSNTPEEAAHLYETVWCGEKVDPDDLCKCDRCGCWEAPGELRSPQYSSQDWCENCLWD